jgi:hypothetical protein
MVDKYVEAGDMLGSGRELTDEGGGGKGDNTAATDDL